MVGIGSFRIFGSDVSGLWTGCESSAMVFMGLLSLCEIFEIKFELIYQLYY